MKARGEGAMLTKLIQADTIELARTPGKIPMDGQCSEEYVVFFSISDLKKAVPSPERRLQSGANRSTHAFS